MEAQTDAGKKLLRATEDILANPQHFNMSLFIDKTGFQVDGTCGTTACIGGWVACRENRFKILKNFVRRWYTDPRMAPPRPVPQGCRP